MEALQQSIIQRPNLVMGGLNAARGEADQRRLFEMQRQGQLVQGILQALGLWTDQQRFGANMDETQRQFNANTYVTDPEPGLPPPQTFRGAENARADEQQGWQRNVQGDPGYQANQRGLQGAQLEAAILGIQGEKDQQGWFRGTRPQETQLLNNRVAGSGLQNDAAQQGLDQNQQQMDQSAWRFGNEQADRPGQVQDQQIQRDSAKQQSDWLKKFQSAPDDATRFQIMGENPQMWFEMQMTGMKLDAAQTEAQIKAGNPADYAMEELRKSAGKYEGIGVTGADGFIQIQPEAAQKARDMEALKRQMIEAIRTKAIEPMAGESREAFLGRVMFLFSQGQTPAVATPGSQAASQSAAPEDFSTGVR